MSRVKNFFSLLVTIFNSRRLRTILAALIFFIGAFGYLFYASEPQVETFGDGIWWALVTITTVGYGDITPLTTLGRVVAGFLMLLGLGLIATITAIVSAKFIQNYVDSHTNDDVLEKLEELETEIEKIEELEDNVLGKLKELETDVDELNKKIQ